MSGLSLRLCTELLTVPRNARTCTRRLYFWPRNVSCRLGTGRIQFYSHLQAHSGITESPALAPTRLSGMEDVLMGYVFGKKKATEVAHSVWKQVVQRGDTVIDATCGNGYDTLAMFRLVKDESGKGRVYGFDLQKDAIKSTSLLLDASLDSNERKSIILFPTCHSRMVEELPEDSCARLVAFNLGYLPGGDKTVITKPGTTLCALEAAMDILLSGGLISLVVYVGHPGGREEFETVMGFATGLSVDEWACTQIQTPNRPSAPVLVFMFKK